MKRILFFIFTFALCLPGSAQNWQETAYETAPGWFKFKESQRPGVDGFFQAYAEMLKINPADISFDLLQSKTDKLGFTHQRYQQLYKGIPVDGAQLLLHLKNGKVVSCNGNLVENLACATSPAISTKQALDAALAFVDAEKYMWETESKIGAFHQESFAPRPQLVITDEKYSQAGENYQLAYKMDIFASEPMARKYVFVDALNGTVIHALERIHHTNDSGVAVTRYSGTQPIVTDSVGPNQWRLRQTVTGSGVETFNMQNSRNFGNAVDFTDTDNYWDNANAQKDEIAGDVHFGTESVYKYFYDFHGRDSYDDQGALLQSYVHYGNNYVNAFWNGSWMTYGDGSGAYDPLVSLDVIGHEISHGVTGNSAGLIYRSESGALNESFSDIFGTAFEFEYDSAKFDYEVGEDFVSGGLRNMADPKSFGDPNTYKGQNWGNGIFVDNGYVHSNSGVQNFWFYILAEGRSGRNDVGSDYVINGIGVRKAADISYRNLVFYLTPTSDHEDARQGAIRSAEDLYGACSAEAIETANAWYAVGVGAPTGDKDIALTEVHLPSADCSLGSNEPLMLTVKNNSCNFTIPAGDTLNFSYTLNNGNPVSESLVLSQALAAGSTMQYTFTSGVDLSQIRQHNLAFAVTYSPDTRQYNNQIASFKLENRKYQNTDFALLEIISPVDGCGLNDSTNITALLYFNGCDSVVAGSTVDFSYKINNQATQNIAANLPQTVFSGDTFQMTLNTAFDASAAGLYDIDLDVNYAGDTINNNDVENFYRALKPYNLIDKTLSFETWDYNDTLVEYFGPEANGRRVTNPSHGNRSYEFTGGNIVYYPKDFVFPTPSNAWSVNDDFASSLCGCVDATNHAQLSLTFDLRQEYSRLFNEELGQNLPFTSVFRVTVDGQQVSQTYRPFSFDNDNWKTHTLDLNSYAGTQFEICFEARALARRINNGLTNDGDEVQLDYIRFSGSQIGMAEQQANLNLRLFPNPTAGELMLELPSAASGDYTVKVQDLSGKVLFNKTIEVAAGQRAFRLQVNAASGVYLLSVENESGLSNSRKLVIR